jgi:signal transduction histidine kinase
MIERYTAYIKKLFTSRDTFTDTEWILQQQIFAMLVVSFAFGIGIFLFAIYRVTHDNMVAGIGQFVFSFFLLFGFVKLKQDKTFYRRYSMMFFFLFFIYIHIVFFFVPQNHLNILWITTAPVLIFFFLDKRGGMIFFILLLGFFIYLLLTSYPYSIVEYITLFAALSIITLIMYVYDKVKEAERNRLLSYNMILEKKIEKKTKKLEQLNQELEKRVIQEVNKQLAQEEMLLRQSRMASMGEMIDAIAHQWRQPLMNINAVMMNIDRGIEKQQDTVQLKEKILEIFSLTKHMSHTIEDFRNLLKDEKEKHNFLVEDIIDTVLALMKNNLKGIDVQYNIENSITVHSYKGELAQVLIILLSNALEILQYKNIENKKIVFNLKQNHNYAVIDIEDNGGGIEEKNLDKIFDPYFSTKKQTGGTGLGLYIAKIIIENHIQGNIFVSNTKEGALFTIHIPL